MFFKMDNENKKLYQDLPYFRLGRVNNVMRTDIYEDENQYIILIDVPGYNKEDLKITIDGEYLEVTGTREKPLNEENYMHEERIFGTHIRKFYVGNIRKESVDAKLENGVLELNIPKEDSKKTEYIEIK